MFVLKRFDIHDPNVNVTKAFGTLTRYQCLLLSGTSSRSSLIVLTVGKSKALLIVGYEWHRFFCFIEYKQREETIHVFINYRPIPIAPNYQTMHLFFFRSFEIYFLFCCIIKI
jgi:hypothetical protein